MSTKELIIKVEVDIEDDCCCENCERELKVITDNGKKPLTNLNIPEGFALILVPDHSGDRFPYYHIELIDRTMLRRMPHPMQWKCLVCGKIFKTKGKFKIHIAKEAGIPVESVAFIDDAIQQKFKSKSDGG